MYQENGFEREETFKLAALGSDLITYMREISSDEIILHFPEVEDDQIENACWALFAADGTPLMLANDPSALENSAFYNNLIALRPN